jgi:GNAT superfamily N-acetyltransferase
MSIRSATIWDWEGISRLLTQLEYPGTAVFIQSKLERMLNDPAETLLVWAEPAAPSDLPQALPKPSPTPSEASSIFGFLSLHFIPQIALPGDFARISYFAVDDEARSHGIGRQLEETATRLATERGCVLMEVHCHTRRTRAHEFYARQGWTESPKYLIKKL